jgi:hypothetical protein
MSSFAVQNLNNFILALFLGGIWRRSTTIALRCQEDIQRLDTIEENNGQLHLDLKLLHSSSSLLVRWQLTLILISIAFFVYAVIFWTQIIVHRDFRFILEAVIGQFMWILTICLTGLPLFITWQGWLSYKAKVVTHFLNIDWSGDNKYNDKLSAIQDLSPIGSSTAVVTGITVVSSLFLPIIQAYIKSKFG